MMEMKSGNAWRPRWKLVKAYSDDGADEDVGPRGEQDAPGSPPEDGDSKGDDLDLFLESLSAEEMEKFTAQQAVKATISSVRESVVKAMKIRSHPK